MKILVTGSGGQLASALCEARGPAGLEVIARGRLNLDVTSPPSIERALSEFGPDLVVNAAAYTAVDAAETDAPAAWAVNAEGAGHVARACAARGIALIHISTDYVFDGMSTRAYVDDDPTNPLSVYGRSKRAGEEQVLAASGRALVVRTSWVHSPFGHNFVKTMLRLAASRPEVGVVADQHGSPTYAPHLADGLLALAAKFLAPGAEAPAPHGIYHLAGAGTTSWHGLAAEVFRCSAAMGGPSPNLRAITTAEYPTPAKRPMSAVLDCSRIGQDYRIELPDWRSGVALCVARLVQSAARPNGIAGNSTPLGA